jgi:hypothetical protein
MHASYRRGVACVGDARGGVVQTEVACSEVHDLKVTAMVAETRDAWNDGYANETREGDGEDWSFTVGVLLEPYEVDGDRRPREDALIVVVVVGP